MKRGAVPIMALFLLTIVCAVLFHQVLHHPSATGMMMGLAFLKFFGYYLNQSHARHAGPAIPFGPMEAEEQLGDHFLHRSAPFDVFQRIARAEWDTLLFFCGIILCVGGSGFICYLARGQYTFVGHLKSAPVIALG